MLHSVHSLQGVSSMTDLSRSMQQLWAVSQKVALNQPVHGPGRYDVSTLVSSYAPVVKDILTLLSLSLACPVIWGRCYDCLFSSSMMPCLLRCPISSRDLILQYRLEWFVIMLLGYKNYNLILYFIF